MSNNQPKTATVLTPVSVTGVTDGIGDTSKLRDTEICITYSVTVGNQPKIGTAVIPMSV